MQLKQWLDGAAADATLMDDFNEICSFGGRRSGSGQDSAALDWALGRLAETGHPVQRINVPYDGWQCLESSLRLEGSDAVLACKPLLRSASTPAGGLRAEVIDLGAGRKEDFDRAGDAVKGKAVLVRHEYPFSGDHMHRRRKYDLALERGAAAFLIASPWPGGGLLSGSSGRAYGKPGIPAAYVDFETAETLRAALVHGRAVVSMVVRGKEEMGSVAGVGILEIPGGRDGKVVISAHMDGHDLGESALDNATGVAVALAAARALAPHVGPDTPGLTICFFCAEEWALSGSARYLDDLAPEDRDRIKLNINLDTVAGDESLTALLSDYPALEPYVNQAAAVADVPVGTWLPLMPNSDHANFARHGIPAFRLVAGFNKPDSRVNNILSPGDVRGIIREEELRQALRVTCAMGRVALSMSDEELEVLKAR